MSSATDTTDTTPLDPYTVLSLPRTATPSEIRSAYLKLALTTHPDKASTANREVANTTFQRVAFAYSILSDETRRKRYDATGSLKESVLDKGEDGEAWDWAEYFREKFEEVGKEEVERFRKEFQGSEEEREAVLRAYTDSEGSLDVVFEEVMCSNPIDDEERFCGIIDAAIKAGEVEAYKKYTKETKVSKDRRRKEAEKEAKEAEEYAKELGVHEAIFGAGEKGKERAKGVKKGKAKKEPDMGGLEALIKKRNANRLDALVDSLEAKYGSKASKRVMEEEPDEEAFQATRAKMAAKTGKRSKRS
ncbi:DnaJ-domain-containing protein [Ascodesmis nigricans]|uniref:DnaJ-domain-containing protein n=1 Tax=Ascodesmis nigricans TaxID=341454 RepID=A0A4S2MNK2_9PEZI|nr:DnaJ-domain-containing protein [Ascodesmis nigricans]